MKDDTTTLYLRGVSRSVVRQLKTEAARRGQPLGRVISDVIASSLGAAPAGDDLTSDIEYFERHRSALARRFPGEHVAVLDGRVIDHDHDFERVAERVFEKHGARSILIRRTTAVGPVRIRSPRVRRP